MRIMLRPAWPATRCSTSSADLRAAAFSCVGASCTPLYTSPRVCTRLRRRRVHLHQRYTWLRWLVLTQALSCAVYDRSLVESSEGPQDQTAVMKSVNSDAGYGIGDVPSAQALAAETRCGDGVISGVEKCDIALETGSPGACPIQCPPLAACANRVLNGTACQAECVLVEPSCEKGDQCCPSYCNPGNDDDCSHACGNGKIETDLGETCEPNSNGCEQSDADCDDADPCTSDKLIGGPENCNSLCTHTTMTALVAGDSCCPAGANAKQDSDCKAVCGNALIEPGEDCDGGEGCDVDCKLTQTPLQQSCLQNFAKDACQRCSCISCTDPFLACRMADVVAARPLCGALSDCTERTHCQGAACYCQMPPFCVLQRGPCQTEVEQAAGSTDPLRILSLTSDTKNALGLAYAADACRQQHCADVCSQPVLR
jgi:hypothetical protein